MIIFLILISLLAGAGCVVVTKVFKDKEKSHIDLLLDQISYLPIINVSMEYLSSSSRPTMELEGGIKLIKGINGAWIEYKEIAIGVPNPESGWSTFDLSKSQMKYVNRVMLERLAEHAFDNALESCISKSEKLISR